MEQRGRRGRRLSSRSSSSSVGGDPCRLRCSQPLDRTRSSDENLPDFASCSATATDHPRTVTINDLPSEILFRVFQHCNGTLMKRVTSLFPPMERVDMMVRFIGQFLGQPELSLNEPLDDLVEEFRRWRQYGAFLSNAIVGWGDRECKMVLDALLGLFHGRLLTTRVLEARPGELVREEVILRHIFLGLLLTEVVRNHRGAWLFRLLQPLPVEHRARLLVIIYGPCRNGEILWSLPPLQNAPARVALRLLLRRSLATMAAALVDLHDGVMAWTQNDTIEIIEKLFETLDERRPLDRARMLMHCGVDICVLYMNKLHKELPGEAANLLIHLVLVDSDEPGSTPFAKQVVRELHNRGVNMSFLRHIRRRGLEFLHAWLIDF